MEAPARFSLWQRLQFWLATHVGGRLLRWIFATCRIEVVENPEADRRLFAGQARVIGATWHRCAVFFLCYYGPLHPAIMVSRSKDGEFLARYLSFMGCRPVRGSSSRGGAAALKEMQDLLASGQCPHAATVADGPRGPRYRAKAGMILLAMRSGLPLLPLVCSADRAWIFRKSWDRTMIPKPFSTIRVAYGRELRYPPDLDKEGLAAARLELEQELNRLREKVDRLCGHQDPA